MSHDKRLVFRKWLLVLSIGCCFIACNENSFYQKNFTCKAYADEHNATFLERSYGSITIDKEIFYIVQKGASFIAPIVEGNEIRVEIRMINIDDDDMSDCVSIKQDKNDIYDAYIGFY